MPSLEGILPTQRSNPGVLHCRWILYSLSHQGSPIYAVACMVLHSFLWLTSISPYGYSPYGFIISIYPTDLSVGGYVGCFHFSDTMGSTAHENFCIILLVNICVHFCIYVPWNKTIGSWCLCIHILVDTADEFFKEDILIYVFLQQCLIDLIDLYILTST